MLAVNRHFFASCAALVCAAAFSTSALAILLDRGEHMVYDPVLDITWARNAGLGGAQTWAEANAWAASLLLEGFDDWRLPYASVAAGAGPTGAVHTCTGMGGADEVACRDNELGYMFYYNLGGTLSSNKTGLQTAIGGEELFNIQSGHWSATAVSQEHIEAVYDPDNCSGPLCRDLTLLRRANLLAIGGAWYTGFADGVNGFETTDRFFGAWAVRSGDVFSAVPEPATLALFGLGLAGLGFSRRKRTSA